MKSMLSFAKRMQQVGFMMVVSIILSAFLTHADCAQEALLATQSVPYGANPSAGHYLRIGDAKIYYEIYGQGEPLVLLHGGLFGYIDEFKNIIPDLSRDHLVIAIATRGHGKSQLGTQPLSYRLLAEDFATVIREVAKGQVNVLGFSDGAIAAYHLGSAYPELVKRLIAVGGPLGLNQYTDEGLAELDSYDTLQELEKLAPDFVANRKKLMPDQSVWNRFLAELVKMWKQREYISREQVRSIRCPALIAGGDRDQYVNTEHFVEIYHLLPKGQLAIVPESGHTVFNSKPAVMIKLIRDFLANTSSATFSRASL